MRATEKHAKQLAKTAGHARFDRWNPWAAGGPCDWSKLTEDVRQNWERAAEEAATAESTPAQILQFVAPEHMDRDHPESLGMWVPSLTAEQSMSLRRAEQQQGTASAVRWQLIGAQSVLDSSSEPETFASLKEDLRQADGRAAELETAARHEVYRIAEEFFAVLGLRRGDLVEVDTQSPAPAGVKPLFLPTVRMRYEQYTVSQLGDIEYFTLMGSAIAHDGTVLRQVEALASLTPGSCVRRLSA